MSDCRACGRAKDVRSGLCPHCDGAASATPPGQASGPVCRVCGGRKDRDTRLCATCDFASYTANADEQHLYALMSGTTRQVRQGKRDSEKLFARLRSHSTSRSRARPLAGRPGSLTVARVSGIAFLVAVVVALGYTLTHADTVVSPVIERQQESLRGFLSDARDTANLWLASAEVIPESSEEPINQVAGDDFLVRLLPEVTVTEDGPYSFLTVGESDEPARFDPCRPVYWAVNPEGEPGGGRELTQAAFDTISEYTGLRFEYVGETTERWVPERDIRNEFYEGVGEWKPVVVWWLEEPQIDAAITLVNPEESGRPIAGFAGPVGMSYGEQGSRYVSVSGQVVMNATFARDYLAGGTPAEVTWVLLHEIGHLVGLGHVTTGGHLMQQENYGSQSQLGPGDRQGLALAGAGPCLGPAYPTQENYQPYFTTPTVVYLDDEHGHDH